MTIFNYIKATPFFKHYLPEIKNVKHKLRGKNGRGNTLSFSPEEKQQISEAVKRMVEEHNKYLTK